MAVGDTRLRFHIAGRWSADDFSQVFRTSDDIYNLVTVLSAEALRDAAVRRDMFPLDRRKVRKIASRITNRPWLDVRSISYASPGHIDLVGFGAVVGHIKDFAFGILDRYQSRGFRRLELREKLRPADKAAFEDEMSRNNQLALARHNDKLRAVEIATKQAGLERRRLQNNALHLANLDTASAFVQRLGTAAKNNDLSSKEMKQLGTWLDSRAAPIAELAELKQIVEIEVHTSNGSDV